MTQNIHQTERIASVIAGSALVAFGLRKAFKYHSLPGAGLAIAGAALIKRGVTGHCEVYHSLGVTTEEQHPGANTTIPYQQGVRVDRSITINAGREVVYDFWRNLENLPQFMKHVRCIKETDEQHSHWIVEGPAGQTVEWDAEIINEIPGELLAWRSLPGALVNNAGSVRFEHATAGRGTKVSVSLTYKAPAGQVGAAMAKLFGADPAEEVEAELHRLKSIIEAGEVPTSAGQPAGRVDAGEKQARQHVKKLAEKVHAASEESFPASDAPAYSHVNGQ
jgi:uncharacterized membrane protein